MRGNEAEGEREKRAEEVGEQEGRSLGKRRRHRVRMCREIKSRRRGGGLD
jgi:hypothetical protein